MISENIKKQITSIWDKYIANNKKVQDTKGTPLDNIDENRIEAIEILKMIIEDFLIDKIDINEFKTDIDSFNKLNNLWGFTSIKGQMFFNLLLKTNDTDEQLKKLTKNLKNAIAEPKNLDDALSKIEELEKFTRNIFDKAPDRRKAPNPGSVCYFLSYFWQVHNHDRWPIMYSSMIVSFTDIGLWKEQSSQKEAYNEFYNLNEEVKKILTIYTGKNISNWAAEHAFWNFRAITASHPKTPKAKNEQIAIQPKESIQPVYKASFDIYKYIIPAVANLIELGNEAEKSSASKGSQFEKSVSEIFRQLDFQVEILGQGRGRNPDAIIKFKEEHIAFIVDAKAYGSGYSLGLDDRAIKEYINFHCPLLKKEGLTKIGFIIVSNSFKTNFETFINDVTWNTEIKRFVLLESEALLHLLAYKNKEKLSLSIIIESIVSFGNLVTAQNVIEKFDDI